MCSSDLPNLKAGSVADLVAFAKANPGKLNVGSNGVGTTLHLSGELFKLRTATDMVHVAYKGWADCVTGLLGGQIDLMFDNLSTALPNVNAGKTRALAVMSSAMVSLGIGTGFERHGQSVPPRTCVCAAAVLHWVHVLVPHAP